MTSCLSTRMSALTTRARYWNLALMLGCEMKSIDAPKLLLGRALPEHAINTLSSGMNTNHLEAASPLRDATLADDQSEPSRVRENGESSSRMTQDGSELMLREPSTIASASVASDSILDSQKLSSSGLSRPENSSASENLAESTISRNDEDKDILSSGSRPQRLVGANLRSNLEGSSPSVPTDFISEPPCLDDFEI